jgi:hypothetical protein
MFYFGMLALTAIVKLIILVVKDKVVDIRKFPKEMSI